MPDIYFVNGKFTDRDNAVISVEDRGFQFADGLYEVIRTYNGKIFRLEDHVERMSMGLKVLGFEQIEFLEDFRKICKEAHMRSTYKDSLIYIQITRGIAKRNHIIPKGLTPNIILIVYKLPEIPEEQWEKGIKVKLLPDTRWLMCSIKTIQLLPNSIAKTLAASEGGYEAILHRNGMVTEAASSNVFIVKNNVVKTHPADETILHGITRKLVLRICKENFIDIREESFTVNDLVSADEVFITNTLDEVKPVTMIEDSTVGNGIPGPFTLEILRLFRNVTAS